MKLVCSKCGGKNIQALVWVDANELTYNSDGPNGVENEWCDDCEEHLKIISKRQYDEKANYEE